MKGGTLVATWIPGTYRATRDIDLAGHGESSTAYIDEMFGALCQMQVPEDGLDFDASTLTIEEIRDADKYDGHRVKLNASLDGAAIRLQVDIGFGPPTQPPPKDTAYPTMLSHEAPVLLTVTPEVVIAEKIHAVVNLGLANSRLKDYYDVWVLSRALGLSGEALLEAITTTFRYRQTEIPDDVPVGLTDEFADGDRQQQWGAFLARVQAGERPELVEVMAQMRSLILPVFGASRTGRFEAHWPAGGTWTL